MELRAGETELYAGRPSWRALMSFYVGGIGLAALVLVILGLLAGEWALAAAVAAAVRNATGADLTRVPIRPEHLVADLGAGG